MLTLFLIGLDFTKQNSETCSLNGVKLVQGASLSPSVWMEKANGNMDREAPRGMLLVKWGTLKLSPSPNHHITKNRREF